MTQVLLRETIGCFNVEQLSKGRWRVKNSYTEIEHVTYGTEQEIREQLEIQTKAWEQRLANTKGARMIGGSWKDKRAIEINRKKTETA